MTPPTTPFIPRFFIQRDLIILNLMYYLSIY